MKRRQGEIDNNLNYMFICKEKKSDMESIKHLIFVLMERYFHDKMDNKREKYI